MTNRHVPFIVGVASVAGAGWLLFRVHGPWSWIVGPLLLMFGLGSLKTAVVAGDQEIRELTTTSPMSSDTEDKLRKRF